MPGRTNMGQDSNGADDPGAKSTGKYNRHADRTGISPVLAIILILFVLLLCSAAVAYAYVLIDTDAQFDLAKLSSLPIFGRLIEDDEPDEDPWAEVDAKETTLTLWEEDLTALAAQLEAKEAELASKEQQLAAWEEELTALSSELEGKKASYQRLAAMYEEIRPANAAALLGSMSEREAASILAYMDEETAAKILQAMNTSQAARLIEAMKPEG